MLVDLRLQCLNETSNIPRFRLPLMALSESADGSSLFSQHLVTEPNIIGHRPQIPLRYLRIVESRRLSLHWLISQRCVGRINIFGVFANINTRMGMKNPSPQHSVQTR